MLESDIGHLYRTCKEAASNAYVEANTWHWAEYFVRLLGPRRDTDVLDEAKESGRHVVNH